MTASAPPSDGPREGHRLDLKLGFACNNRCVFCVQGNKRDEIPPRSTAECRALLEAHRARSDTVVLTGGEASIRDDVVELVAHAKALGYSRIHLQTNGRRLAYLPFALALQKAGLTAVSPALHGSHAALHDELTRARGAFSQCVRGIANTRLVGLPVMSNTVVVQRNVADLPALARLLVALGVTQMQFAFVHPAGTAQERFHEVVPRFADAMPYLHAALDVARAAGVTAFTEAVPYCVMHGYEAHVVERIIPDTCVLDGPMVIEDYTAYRWTEGKTKRPECQTCAYDPVCEGPWREYPQEYGWDELQPRR